MKVRVDEDLCVGCGLCVNTCPDIFVMKDDKAITKVSVVPAASEESAKQSKDECPVEAIIID
ncbi:MAG: ferredoxin [Candidatus Omnitrophica bacterium CG_4_9_14_0_2_um_filter_42_8]|nr:MAG: ferredoxin [Candidatus Omnitrophica bacterium CG22_combo_CG10-13_8_21_14_all_43_16]PJC48196.1 MAG: ferredoxin [Candidatus Omnitrophica bacterium CG_4_9_14_0_2_um_filter_42_8]